MSKIKKILIVCTGNSCRSPMAEAFLKNCLKPKEEFEIISAGISAVDGFPPTKETIEVMAEEGIDISRNLSRPFFVFLAKAADLILVMSDLHRDFILKKMPEAKDKIYLYKEFARSVDAAIEIADPIGQPLTFYRKIRDEIKDASVRIAQRIMEDK
jgi:protein-tyrosine-phosphatase